MHRFLASRYDRCIDSWRHGMINASNHFGIMIQVILPKLPFLMHHASFRYPMHHLDKALGRFFTYDASDLYDASSKLSVSHNIVKKICSARRFNYCWGIGSTAPFSHYGPLLETLICWISNLTAQGPGNMAMLEYHFDVIAITQVWWPARLMITLNSC